MQEDLVKISQGIKAQKFDMSGLNSKNSDINDFLNHRSQEVQLTLLKELEVIRDEMKKGFANQTSESLRLNQQINQLNSEEVTLRSQIEALEKRLRNIEAHVGIYDN
jgi:predicted  nucleic acid-binding Zn-ribbon protein